MAPTRGSYVQQSLGISLATAVKGARVLMVGAGGIGCELLKNLVLTGFGEIHVVDLDTIDLSNLNRQFLFGHRDIKKAKALVAKEAAGKFNPNVNIEAYHANVKDARFNIDFFKRFHIVFNALDNVDARRHVNKMCIAADVAMVDSGTTGFNGHAQVIKKGLTECYDCKPKETPKSYPVCTIRSTPSQPIHCIVWAKSYLFTEIFGVSEEDVPELDLTEDSENAQEIKKLREEAAALKKIRESMGTTEFPRLLFEKVFMQDVDRLRGMEDMWKSRRPPEPLDFNELDAAAADSSKEEDVDVAAKWQDLWAPHDSFSVFIDSLERLSKRVLAIKSTNSSDSTDHTLSFDKDDEDTLDFVAAAANLRSIVFGIPVQTKFEIKRMAGNIIPAIATTNAIFAGLAVLEAFKILRGDMKELQKAVPVFNVVSTERRISAEASLFPPNPDCPVCGAAWSKLTINPERSTLSHLVGKLKEDMGYSEEFSVTTDDARIVYDPDLEDNLGKTLSELGIGAGSFITVTDGGDEEPRVDLVLAVVEDPDTEDVLVLDKIDIPAKKVKVEQPATADVNGVPASKAKRKADEAGLGDEHRHKMGKTKEAVDDGDVVMLAHPNEGAILID